MDYIVVDFEWNQSPYGKNGRKKKLPFEIIEIGAVKLNEKGEYVDSFEVMIKPSVYKKMNRITSELTHITDADLEKGVPFRYAIVDFMLWCGDEFMFCTWGNMDLYELQRNMKHYHLEDLLRGPVKYYNVQKLFRILYNDDVASMSLEKAIDYFELEKKDDFHRAVSDARYTAKIFAIMDMAEVKKWYTVDFYRNPKSKKEEIKLTYETYFKYISREFNTKEEAMADREVRTTKCYKCGQTAVKKLRWFVNKNKCYYCVAYCEEHGYIRGKIRLKKTDEDKYFAIKTLRMISQEDAKRIYDMKNETRQKRHDKNHREG